MNNKVKISTIALAVAAVSSLQSFAQDLRYAQSFANPLKLNPAIMGANPDFKLSLNYRDQWSLIDKGYVTTSFTALYPVFMKEGKSKLDIGVGALNDKAGAFNKLDFSLALAYSLRVSDFSSLSLALQGGYVQKTLDNASLMFDEQYVNGEYSANNPHNENTLTQAISYADVGFGAMWFYNPSREDGGRINAYMGMSGFHLNQPNESYVAGAGVLAKKFSYQGGIKILGEGKLDFTPNIRITTQSGAEEIAAGLYVDYRFNEKAKLVLGSWYRKDDAVAFALGFEHKNFIIGYSYDVVTSQLSTAAAGINAYEVTLAYKINKADKNKIKFNGMFSSF